MTLHDPKLKIECSVCHVPKLPLHFYVNRGRLSRDCKMCRRKKTSVRSVPNFECGEYQFVQSGYGGPITKQFVRPRKRHIES
jgi:hypothetical protein